MSKVSLSSVWKDWSCTILAMQSRFAKIINVYSWYWAPGVISWKSTLFIQQPPTCKKSITAQKPTLHQMNATQPPKFLNIQTVLNSHPMRWLNNQTPTSKHLHYFSSHFSIALQFTTAQHYVYIHRNLPSSSWIICSHQLLSAGESSTHQPSFQLTIFSLLSTSLRLNSLFWCSFSSHFI